MEIEKAKTGRKIGHETIWAELSGKIGSYSKIAEGLGVSLSTINNWISGKHRVPLTAQKELVRLCEIHEINWKQREWVK